MKSKYIHIFIISSFALLLSSGCVTYETYIRNEEIYSQKIPIEKKPTFLIFGEKFILNDYSLRFKRKTPRGIAYTVGIATMAYGRNITGRRYDFHKNGLQLYTVDITTSDRSLYIGDITVTFDINMAIIIHNNNTIEKFKINLDKQQPYVLFNDSTIGEIKFDYYKSRNKNTPKDDWETLTGFKISVNNEEYGILAFYPPSLHLKDNNEINDKMALYTLAAYAHYFNYGRK